MNKFSDFILNGKGWGLKYLFYFTLLFIGGIGLFLIPTLKFETMDILSSVVKEISVLEIKDGKVITPLNLQKTILLKNQPILHIDTTINELDIPNLSDGTYLTKENFYIISTAGNQQMINSTKLDGDFKLDKNTLTELSANMNYFIYGFLIPIMILISWLFIIIKVLILTFISYILTFISDQKLSFSRRMRLNTLIFLSLIFITVLMSPFNIVLDVTSLLAISVIIQSVYFLKMDQKEDNQTD